MELRFVRDTDKREGDFVVIKDGSPEFAVECKLSYAKASSKFEYFKQRTDIPRFYLVHLGKKDFGDEETEQRVLPLTTFCQELGMPKETITGTDQAIHTPKNSRQKMLFHI